MRALILLVLFFFFINLFSQPGFNLWYGFDTGVSFRDINYQEDTLYTLGTAYDIEAGQWGLFFMKMDTLGNIYDHRLHLDPQGKQYAFSVPTQVTPTDDGGFLMPGVYFGEERYFMAKIDRNGAVVFIQDYEWANNIISVLPYQLIEVDDGYYFFCSKQFSNGKSKVSITRLDELGNVLWEQFYAHPFANAAGLSSVWQKDENTYVVGNGFGYFNQLDTDASWAKSWIFAVDSLGNMLWDWESEEREESSVYGIQQLENGNWIYSTASFYPLGGQNYYWKPKVVHRDSNLNLLWQHELAHSQSTKNRTVDIMPNPDGGFTGVGNWLVPDEEVQGEPDIPGSFFGGCLYRLSSQGDSLWIQCDTGVVEQAFSLSHELRGMTVLPSGSVVGVGEFSHRDLTGYTRPVGWVVKRDKYGCMEELCVLSGLEDLEEQEQPQLKVYPNPANEQLTFERKAEGSLKPATLEIVDMTGRPVHRAVIQREYNWDTSTLPDGLYFYRFFQGGELLQSGKVVVQHL